MHSVHLGVSAPQLSNASSIPVAGPGPLERVRSYVTYPDPVTRRLTLGVERV